MNSRTHQSRLERTRKAERARQQMLTLMAISPRTVAELSTRVTCSESFVRQTLTAFKEQGLCHVNAYIKRDVGGFTATFASGHGKNAKMPKAAEEAARQSAAKARTKETQERAIELAKLRQQITTKVTCYGIWGMA